MPYSENTGDQSLDIVALRRWKPMFYALYSTTTLVGFVTTAWISLRLDFWLAYFVLWMLQAAFLIGASNAAHECTHNLFTPSRTANRWVGAAWMTPLLLSYSVHRRYHLRHHAHTTRDGDPESGFHYSIFPSIGEYLASLVRWLTIFDPLHRLNWGHCVSAIRGDETEFLTDASAVREVRTDILLLLIWLLVAISLSACWPKIMLFGYWVPLVFFFAPMAYVTALPEHFSVTRGLDATLNTRSIHTVSIVRFLFWNFNYHTTHHLYPTLPFHALPTAHRHLSGSFSYLEVSYIGFHIRALRETLRLSRRAA